MLVARRPKPDPPCRPLPLFQGNGGSNGGGLWYELTTSGLGGSITNSTFRVGGRAGAGARGAPGLARLSR